MQREWVIASPHPEREAFAQAARIPTLLAQLLLTRGVTQQAEVDTFLQPSFKSLLPPEALRGAVAAGQRLARAVQKHERIVIFGDYDVDGITATSILWHALHLAGGDVHFYIPSRLDEGYGLNADAVRQLIGAGANLIITVDCGITALAEAQLARDANVDLIITDHHQPQDELPNASVIVHPGLDAASANPNLSGAGVALKVAWAFASTLQAGGRVNDAFRAFLVDATAFAALGLIADVVPLVGENRVIASFGLRHLCQCENPGLRALIEVSGLGGKARVDDFDVGFKLAPRLNAIGRMGHARLAVELFTRADAARAAEIAATLDANNRKRQEVERQITKQAEQMVTEAGYDRDGCRGIVLASAEWHPGVIGIVASRLVDRFGRPTVLIALENGQGQGSGRSIRHFPLHEVLACCGEHLDSFGGHAMAAGVRLRSDRVDAFAEAFRHQAAQRLTTRDLRPQLSLEDEIDLADLTTPLVESIERMAPFGAGNPRPLLATAVVDLVDEPRAVGTNGRHLQFSVRQGRTFRKAIAFGQGPQAIQLAETRRLQLAFEPLLNEWNGRRSVELRVVDWRPAT